MIEITKWKRGEKETISQGFKITWKLMEIDATGRWSRPQRGYRKRRGAISIHSEVRWKDLGLSQSVQLADASQP